MNLIEYILSLPDTISSNIKKHDLVIDISSIAYDSRKVKKDTLFVAIPGFKFDGHDFIPEAIKKGAALIVGEKDLDLALPYIQVRDSRRVLGKISAKFYGYPAKKLNVIGITGTNGKTTTSYLLKAILDEVGFNTGIIGTIGNKIKNKFVPSERTTPESLEINQLFYKMLKENVEYVAMEVSSHSLKLNRVDEICFDVGVFTNLSQDHLDFHESLDDYFKSKKKLFSISKKAVINADDTAGQKIIDTINIPTLTYGIKNQDADIRAEDVKISNKKVSYTLRVENKKLPICYHVPGLFSVYNSLAAIATGLMLGISLETLSDVLKKVKGVPGRFEPIERGQDYTVIVDYAHTPDGLQNVLKTIKSFCRGRIITVFGCGGDRDKTKRPIMGKISSKLSDCTIITSDNPRSENPEKIIDDIENGLLNKNYERIVNRKDAIKKAIKMAQKNDVVLIAGKGHETYQILNDKVIHFDDKELASNFIDYRRNNDETFTNK